MPKKTLNFLQHNLQNGSPDSFELVNDKCDKPEQDFFSFCYVKTVFALLKISHVMAKRYLTKYKLQYQKIRKMWNKSQPQNLYTFHVKWCRIFFYLFFNLLKHLSRTYIFMLVGTLLDIFFSLSYRTDYPGLTTNGNTWRWNCSFIDIFKKWE